MRSSPPPPAKATLTIPSSPPLPPTNLQPAGQKRFLDIEPSSDDIPVFSSDDLPPKEVFENPYQAYRSVRNVKRLRSGTNPSILLRKRAELALQSSDYLDEDGLPSSSSRSKATTQDNVFSDDAEDEANTSMSTIVPPDGDYEDGDTLGDLGDEIDGLDEGEIKANFLIQIAIEEGSPEVDLSSQEDTQRCLITFIVDTPAQKRGFKQQDINPINTYIQDVFVTITIKFRR
ncbi:hypothetical protein ABW19_dt0201706 [Dactylella cylindrospora]|nr:hypothetical protein ABW19_dt0201706 [Dactylella cylindrospora]